MAPFVFARARESKILGAVVSNSQRLKYSSEVSARAQSHTNAWARKAAEGDSLERV